MLLKLFWVEEARLMTDYETLRIEVADKVATIWLNRPEQRNAFSPQMTYELHEAFADLEADDEIRAIVVTGTGSYFSAGADLGRPGGAFSGNSNRTGPYAIEPFQMRTPIIAAMNGSAAGMGVTLPTQWDVRFGTAEAKYGFVFTRRGIVPELSSTWMVPRLIGLSKAMELMLSGRYFSGAEAAEMGLFARALPAAEVLPAALDYARDLAANTSAVSVGATKALIYRAFGEPDPIAAHDRERDLVRLLGGQADSKEAVKAFLEKRPPQWQLSKTKDFPPDL
jgi:enoyl-CoA hydratase/carnithine racemase